MAYRSKTYPATKRSLDWRDNDPTTPLNANRLNDLENRIVDLEMTLGRGEHTGDVLSAIEFDSALISADWITQFAYSKGVWEVPLTAMPGSNSLSITLFVQPGKVEGAFDATQLTPVPQADFDAFVDEFSALGSGDRELPYWYSNDGKTVLIISDEPLIVRVRGARAHNLGAMKYGRGVDPEVALGGKYPAEAYDQAIAKLENVPMGVSREMPPGM